MPPANFNIGLCQNETIQLNPVDLYLNAIVAMYGLATLYRWNEMWPRPTSTFSLVGHALWIRVERDRLELKTLHVVFTLYYTVTTMVDRSQFCEYAADMYQGDRKIGSLDIEQIPATTTLNTSIEAFDSISTTNIMTSDSTSHSFGRGRIIVLPDITITYQYVGDRINSKDLYTAVLSGIGDAAKAGMDTVCTEIQAFSQSANLVFWIFNVDQSIQPLRYKAVTDIFRSITVDMTVEQRRFAEIEFFAKNGTDVIGTGFIRKLPLGGNVTASAVAAR